ncbi:hypothetical protein LPB140_05565 [Sphingorhabdus lutea]|uniref:DUF1761 domain-containing protein n=1 Tax=Sphingorhabdus lutea TaxID=1913578 RepID=A0A1L3JET5_9SPHN|nr:DUF1761 domain-containing protein [Sphingorhabdus lutea]APG63624.1 hypothetical protein LPB140_05565 [Sphingorhabdus lutea]
MANANFLAIFVAALSGFMVGGLWYGPIFGKTWMAEHGFTEDSIKETNMAKLYGSVFLLSLISAFFLGHMLAHFNPDFTRTMMISTGIGAAFVGTAIGTNYLFSQKSLKLFLIDAGYWMCFYAAMGAIFYLFGS